MPSLQLSSEVRVMLGQLGSAVLQGVFGKGGFHGQGLAFAADLGVVYFHFRAGTQTDALLAAAVADEDEVLQYGVGNGSGGVVAAVVVALHQAVARSPVWIRLL